MKALNGTIRGFLKVFGYVTISETLHVTGDITTDGKVLSHVYEEKLNDAISADYIGYFVVPDALDGKSVKEIRIALLGLPGGQAVKVDIRKNGTASTNSILDSDLPMEIGTAQSATNGIYQVGVDTTATETVGTTATFIDVTQNALVADDVLYVYISQVGSTQAGNDFKCEVIIK